MLGLALLLTVVALAALAAGHKATQIACEIQERWWRITPPGVTPAATGTSAALFLVVRKARKMGARSFNYNRASGRYEIFSQWLMNWTQPVDYVVSGAVPMPMARAVHVTGTVADGTTVVAPAPCCEKIKCEMRAYGLFPDGRSLRDWSRANPADSGDTHYYDVKKAAAEWPSKDGTAQPPAKVSKDAALVDAALETRMKLTGKAIVGHAPDGSIQLASDGPGCSGACDFCTGVDGKGNCLNPTAAFWYGCNDQGRLYSNKEKTAVYSIAGI